MSDSEKTGVFATPEEIARATALNQRVRETPLIKIGNHWPAEAAVEDLMTFIDAAAVAHGLPKPGTVDGDVDHYGMLLTGEFTRRSGQLTEEVTS